MSNKKDDNPAIGRSGEEVRSEIFTREEKAGSDLGIALITELIRVRQEKGLSQKNLKKLME